MRVLMQNLFLILLLVPIGASSQDLSPKIQDIVRITMASDGYLSDETHGEFWEEINKLGTPEEIKVATEVIQGSIILASEYQRETWASAKESATKRKVIKSKRLIELEDEYPRKYKESMIKALPYSQHEPAVQAFDNQFATVRKNTSNLLKASANKTSMLSVQGERTQVIDLNIINTSLKAIESSFKRVTNLLDPNWKKSEDVIYLVGDGKFFINTKVGDIKITLLLDKPSSLAEINGKPYDVYAEDHRYRFISSKGGFISKDEKEPFYLDRTSLILRNGLDNYRMRIVDVHIFEAVSKQIIIDKDRAEKQKRADAERKRKEKLDARKL
jgi:hypothetical protein